LDLPHGKAYRISPVSGSSQGLLLQLADEELAGAPNLHEIREPKRVQLEQSNLVTLEVQKFRSSEAQLMIYWEYLCLFLLV
jgi:hypothetical protein